jgi:hypothetical protein
MEWGEEAHGIRKTVVTTTVDHQWVCFGTKY